MIKAKGKGSTGGGVFQEEGNGLEARDLRAPLLYDHEPVRARRRAE